MHRSPEAVSTRLDRLIIEIRSKYHEKPMDEKPEQVLSGDILIVAHGHILRAFTMRWIGRNLPDGVSLLLEGMLATI